MKSLNVRVAAIAVLFGLGCVGAQAAMVEPIYVNGVKIIENFAYDDVRGLSVSRGGEIDDGKVMTDGAGVSVIGPANGESVDYSAYNKVLLKNSKLLKPGVTVNDLIGSGEVSAETVSSINEKVCPGASWECPAGTSFTAEPLLCQTPVQCDTGYEFNGVECIKDSTTTVAITKTYYCDSGYYLTSTSYGGKGCYSQTYSWGSKYVKYSCPNGYTKINSSTCSKGTILKAAASCPIGSLNSLTKTCSTSPRKLCK